MGAAQQVGARRDGPARAKREGDGTAPARRCLGSGRGTGSPGGQVKGRWVVECMPLTSAGPADYNEGKHGLTVSPALAGRPGQLRADRAAETGARGPDGLAASRCAQVAHRPLLSDP